MWILGKTIKIKIKIKIKKSRGWLLQIEMHGKIKITLNKKLRKMMKRIEKRK